jgi:hypothetical protein
MGDEDTCGCSNGVTTVGVRDAVVLIVTNVVIDNKG